MLPPASASRAVAAERRKKNSTIRAKIEEILTDEVAGDPIDGTRWSPNLQSALSRAYVPAGTRGGFWLYRPRP